MRRQTYLETLVKLFDDLCRTGQAIKHYGIKIGAKPTYREKLEGILQLYDGMLEELSKQMTEKEMLGDFSCQECALVSAFIRSYLNDSKIGEIPSICMGVYGAHVYKIANNFGGHLLKTKLDVPTSVVPNKPGKIYMIEFPDGVSFKGPDGELHWNCIAAFGFGPDRKSLSLQVCSLDMAHPDTIASIVVMDISNFRMGLISEAIDNHIATYGKLIYPPEMIHYIVKCILYIESGNPDLTPEEAAKATKPKKIAALKHKDLYPFPIVRVGYSFHKEYSLQDSMVSGHFRWQPYGPQLSLVKLIWIEEYTSKRRKREE